MWRIFHGYNTYMMAMLSVSYLPLSISTVAQMSQIFVTLFISYYFAGEKLSRREITSIVISFIGIIIVVIPLNQ